MGAGFSVHRYLENSPQGLDKNSLMESSDGGGVSKNEDRGARPKCVAHRTKRDGGDLHLVLQFAL